MYFSLQIEESVKKDQSTKKSLYKKTNDVSTFP
jgi:hypothetical protein